MYMYCFYDKEVYKENLDIKGLRYCLSASILQYSFSCKSCMRVIESLRKDNDDIQDLIYVLSLFWWLNIHQQSIYIIRL